MIKITFPDGSVREYNEGVNGLQIAESISTLRKRGRSKRKIKIIIPLNMWSCRIHIQ